MEKPEDEKKDKRSQRDEGTSGRLRESFLEMNL